MCILTHVRTGDKIKPFGLASDCWYVCVWRTKANLDLNDELARSKRMLDEKYFEAGRLRDEAVQKGDQNSD